MRSLPGGGGRVFFLFILHIIIKILDVQKTVRYNESTENCTWFEGR